MNTSTIVKGLQEGDVLHLITDDSQHIYVKAAKTRGGYVKLEVELPRGWDAERLLKREELGK